MTKSLLQIFDLQFPRYVKQASEYKFRSNQTIQFMYHFAPHYALKTNLGIRKKHEKSFYVNMHKNENAKNHLDLLLKAKPKLFCINNSSPEQKDLVTEYLEKIFPEKSGFEI